MRRKISTLQPISVHRKAHNIRKKERNTEWLGPVLKVKTITKGEYKVPAPHKRYQMICAISRCKNAELR